MDDSLRGREHACVTRAGSRSMSRRRWPWSLALTVAWGVGGCATATDVQDGLGADAPNADAAADATGDSPPDSPQAPCPADMQLIDDPSLPAPVWMD